MIAEVLVLAYILIPEFFQNNTVRELEVLPSSVISFMKTSMVFNLRTNA
jgi:hypothetical protein